MSGRRQLRGRGGFYSIFTETACLKREREFQRDSVRRGIEGKGRARRRAGKVLRLLKRLGYQRFHARGWYGIAAANQQGKVENV